jgi:hypothetical protein
MSFDQPTLVWTCVECGGHPALDGVIAVRL